MVPYFGDIVELNQEQAQLSGNSGMEDAFTKDKLYADINTAMQKIAAGNDIEKLIRVRDFLNTFTD